ncbi:MAG: hypothetical protein HUJ31_07240, partial [Pseudomonadales bacterium]|nr:hypothetical protein [Pseudomonadales bacterium]
MGFAILTIVLGVFGLYLAGFLNYLFFHSVVELFSIIVGCGVFMVAWNCRRLMSNDYLAFVGMIYLSVAMIDFLHVLAYPGMGVFETRGPNEATQLWIAARYLESGCLLLSPFFLNRNLPVWPVMGLFGMAVAAVALLVFGGRFPDCFIEGEGLTSFKIGSEIVISMMLAIALMYLYKVRSRLDDKVFRLVAVSILLTIGSEMSFTLYVDVYGFSNLVGHVLKLASFYLIYKAIIEIGLASPYDLMFRDLSNSKFALEEARQDLEHRIVERTRHLHQEIEARKLSEHALGERVKELSCLSELGRIIDIGGTTGQILQSAVKILPDALQFPESAVASIELEGERWETGDITQCEAVMVEPLLVDSLRKGSVNIGYRHEFPDAWEGPFLA